MIAATILQLAGADGDPGRAIALASTLAILVGAILVGAIMILAAVARLGLIADLLSKPTRIGYMNCLAVTIVLGQQPKLFGFSVDADGLRMLQQPQQEQQPQGDQHGADDNGQLRLRARLLNHRGPRTAGTEREPLEQAGRDTRRADTDYLLVRAHLLPPARRERRHRRDGVGQRHRRDPERSPVE